jgi:hypothetical protein
VVILDAACADVPLFLLQTVLVLPNLERIPSKGDARAERVLERTPVVADAVYLRSINAEVALDLGRYGVRQTTVALRRRSVDLLADALMAVALYAAISPEDADPRDLMVTLSLHHVVARELGSDPATVFADVAARIPGTPVARVLREFAPRRDVTLAAFAWERVETADGPDFAPT